MPLRRQSVVRFAAIWLLLMGAVSCARASVSLLMEEPFGTFGAFNPTGHAAIYLSNVCAETPTRLRACSPGEMGVVISRYHKVHGYDWVAMPLIPYLYAVDDLSDVPAYVTPAKEVELRDSYRRAHLQQIAPDEPGGKTPHGEWIQLVGASYDRRIYGFTLDTTREQDEALVAKLNDGHNRSHFNLFYRNCADFSRSVLRTLYPGSIPRNTMADFWLTTPKHLARLVVKFGGAHPELGYRVFQIPQVPGAVPRSHSTDGIAESLVRSKKYLLPLAYMWPQVSIGLAAVYVGTGRFRAPKDAPLMPELQMPAGGIELHDALLVQHPLTPDDPLACVPFAVPSAPLEGMGEE